MSTKRRISVDVHEDAFRDLNRIALERRVSVPEVCRAAVDLYLSYRSAKEAGRGFGFVTETGDIERIIIPGGL